MKKLSKRNIYFDIKILLFNGLMKMNNNKKNTITKFHIKSTLKRQIVQKSL